MVFNGITYRINAESCYFSGVFRSYRSPNEGPTHPDPKILGLQQRDMVVNTIEIISKNLQENGV